MTRVEVVGVGCFIEIQNPYQPSVLAENVASYIGVLPMNNGNAVGAAFPLPSRVESSYVRTISSRRRTPSVPPSAAAIAPSNKDTNAISDALGEERIIDQENVVVAPRAA